MIRVSTLLGWHDEDFLRFQEKCAAQYLQETMCNFPQIIDKMIEDPYFWDVWFQMWDNRDKIYLESVEFCAYLGIEEDYKVFNHPNQLKVMLPIKSFLRVYNLKTGIQ